MSCNKDHNEGSHNEGRGKWIEYAGTLDGYSFARMIDISYGIRRDCDTLEFIGLRNGKPWFALYQKSTHDKVLEWTDISVLDTSKVYFYDKGYGNKNEFKIKSIAPSFYKFYEGYEVVELTYGRSDFEGEYGPWVPNKAVPKLGIGLTADLIGGGGWLESMQQVIFIKDRIERVVKNIGFTEANCWPCHVRNGYKESVFIGNQCLSNGEVIYTTKGDPTIQFVSPYSAYEDNHYTYTSYEEVVIVDYPICRKNNIKEDKTVWRSTIVPPFDIPSDANPKVELILNERNETEANYLVKIVYYDGTKKDFSFNVRFSDGLISIIN